jgi:hypothetical protein
MTCGTGVQNQAGIEKSTQLEGTVSSAVEVLNKFVVDSSDLIHVVEKMKRLSADVAGRLSSIGGNGPGSTGRSSPHAQAGLRHRTSLSLSRRIDFAHHTGRIADRDAIRWNAFGDNAACTYSAITADADAWKDYHVGADPDVILDDYRLGRGDSFPLFDAVLVAVHDTQVITKQAVTAYGNVFVGDDRCTVIDKGAITDVDLRSLVSEDFHRDDVGHDADGFPEPNCS